ncbi:ferrichrome ABC superfamily ATP binding cassette transporter, ABC protein [Peptoniphilus indolicus ATCC 29427]|uniref:Ferrichrome ABC superfamily ATP binding cassette transporter, ABC protein n=2 Tax=Peptoniphilus indolicus TaxID=33030 RepID=G4D566_9FIRM|nr:ferrichrome ABC superfamily ATP binding cassette transporter, ABC protein [Peptoniphilus indolicus ATCC 29427]
MGTIRLDGKNISDINRKDFAKKVAIVKQKNRLDSDIKVEELVSYGRNPYLPFMARLTEKDYQKIDEAIKLCGLEEIRDKKVNLLSGGQTQRVWIAMAIAQDSDILFLDEPTTYLDIKYQIEILNLVKRLNKNLNKTIIMVLHDINQSIKYADEIVGMYKGKIVFNGKPKETLTEENISKIFDTKLKLAQLEGETIVLAREN